MVTAKALVHPRETPHDQQQAAACERMLRLQMIDMVRSNGVGDLYDWRDERLQIICNEELEKRKDEAVRSFDEEKQKALAAGELCGFTGDDLLPGTQDFGAAGEESRRSDPLLKEHLDRQQGVRKGTFGAFCANYRLARESENPQQSDAANMMKELLPDVKKLGYFRWWVCRDEWAEAAGTEPSVTMKCVEGHKNRWGHTIDILVVNVVARVERNESVHGNNKKRTNKKKEERRKKK
eukprot:CAMPEP_0201515028 /NCGR_PEP_ID=MMETSP0161_2-20130828/6703_1 /ASSEMBLY_ACC=CAM_ASM_000251 /TAXON_ID=180227 /ORGANISM="Neoparamoeba aestuarina, Strain SoJaBio B1-5/56/2" /LENGTH=236 /DNA_ID=CAMNT_0047911731 /DNA_START=98 /DNA_END=804 /DNA_ORIENTATION=-